MDSNIEALKQLSARLVLLTDAIEDKTHDATRRIEASTNDLLQSIESESRTAMNRTAQLAIAPCAEQLKHSAESAKWAAKALGEQRLALSRTQQNLIYLGLLSLIIGCLLALGGTWIWAKHYRDEVARLQPEADFLHALNRADVKVCDGQLCVKFEKRSKKYGEYQLVKPR